MSDWQMAIPFWCPLAGEHSATTRFQLYWLPSPLIGSGICHPSPVTDANTATDVAFPKYALKINFLNWKLKSKSDHYLESLIQQILIVYLQCAQHGLETKQNKISAFIKLKCDWRQWSGLCMWYSTGYQDPHTSSVLSLHLSHTHPQTGKESTGMKTCSRQGKVQRLSLGFYL